LTSSSQSPLVSVCALSHWLPAQTSLAPLLLLSKLNPLALGFNFVFRTETLRLLFPSFARISVKLGFQRVSCFSNYASFVQVSSKLLLPIFLN